MQSSPTFLALWPGRGEGRRGWFRAGSEKARMLSSIYENDGHICPLLRKMEYAGMYSPAAHVFPWPGSERFKTPQWVRDLGTPVLL